MKSRVWPLLLLALTAGGCATTTQDRFAPIEQAVRSCLYSGTAGTVPKASDPATVPPGLSENDVEVKPLTGTALKVFTYEGSNIHMVSCGVAIYGPVPDALRERVTALIAEMRPDLQAQPKSFYIAEGPSAEQRYWGEPRAQGLRGVLLRFRAPSEGAPSLDLHYHKILLF
jgi:hypothetical protein